MPITLCVSCPFFLGTFPLSTSAVKIGSSSPGTFAKRGDYRESHCARLVRFPLISATGVTRKKTPAVFPRARFRDANRKSFLGGWGGGWGVKKNKLLLHQPRAWPHTSARRASADEMWRLCFRSAVFIPFGATRGRMSPPTEGSAQMAVAAARMCVCVCVHSFPYVLMYT